MPRRSPLRAAISVDKKSLADDEIDLMKIARHSCPGAPAIVWNRGFSTALIVLSILPMLALYGEDFASVLAEIHGHQQDRSNCSRV